MTDAAELHEEPPQSWVRETRKIAKRAGAPTSTPDDVKALVAKSLEMAKRLDEAQRAEDAFDLASVRAFLDDPAQPTTPHAVVKRLAAGDSPLAAWRKARGLTQGSLAEAVGTTASYVSQVEIGSRPISNALRPKLAAALDIEEADLLA